MKSAKKASRTSKGSVVTIDSDDDLPIKKPRKRVSRVLSDDDEETQDVAFGEWWWKERVQLEGF